MLLVVPIVVTLERHEFPATLGLFAVAAASDAADGYLAKRFGWQWRSMIIWSDFSASSMWR